MGIYYFLANLTNKKYMTFPEGLKIGEILLNPISNKMVTYFIVEYCHIGSAKITFLGDESGGWDLIDDSWEDVTDYILKEIEDNET